MSDQFPFQRLREVALERRALEADDDVWARRRAGTLSAAEERVLAERAANDPFVAHMLALTEPKKVVSLGSRRRQFLIGAGAIAACAAASLLLVRAPDAVLLPPYEGTLDGVDRTMRAGGDQPESAARQRVSRGARMELIAKPSEPLRSEHAALAAVLFLAREGHLERVSVPVDVGPNGAAHVLAPYDAVFAERTGAWDLVLFVGVADRVPQDAADATRRLASAATDVQVVRFPLQLSR